MKFKFDFISNSSSTSFVYISDEELSEDVFFEAAGVDINGPIGDLFRQMHFEITSAIQDGTHVKTKEEADSLAGSHEFTPEVIEKMKKAIELGKKVVTSSLDSEGSIAESVLCMAMFEIDSERFYINAYNNYW